MKLLKDSEGIMGRKRREEDNDRQNGTLKSAIALFAILETGSASGLLFFLPSHQPSRFPRSYSIALSRDDLGTNQLYTLLIWFLSCD